MKALGLLLLAISFAVPVSAQTPPTELVCDGALSRPHGEPDMELSGILIRISERSISVVGGVFEGDYPITSRDETYLSLSNDNYWGGINRFTGKFSITRNGAQPNTWVWRYSSTCSRQKPIF